LTRDLPLESIVACVELTPVYTATEKLGKKNRISGLHTGILISQKIPGTAKYIASRRFGWSLGEQEIEHPSGSKGIII